MKYSSGFGHPDNGSLPFHVIDCEENASPPKPAVNMSLKSLYTFVWI